MAATLKKCRVCGKEYEGCRSVKTNPGVFRWQEVACSPECGSVYLQQICASRSVKVVETNEPIVEAEEVFEVEPDIDNMTEEEFEAYIETL